MDIVINRCHGGFSLSRDALHKLRKMGNKCALEETDLGEKWPDSNEINNHNFNSYCRDIERTDPDLLKIVKEMGEKADGGFAFLRIVEIPDGVNFEIEVYDGLESIHENHRSWV